MLSAVYLISSLPTLYFGKKPPISMDEFMHDVSVQLSKKNMAKVEKINIQSLSEYADNNKLNSIVTLQGDIKHDVELFRQAKKDNNATKPESSLKTILDSNPLEREKLVLKLQWDELSSIEFGESFTLTEIMIYKLKLQILERLYSFNAEKGQPVYESAMNIEKLKLM